MDVSITSMEKDVETLVRAAFKTAIQQGRATMVVTPSPEGGRAIDIASPMTGTAGINLIVENGDPTIWLVVGRDTPFEICLGKGWPQDRDAIEDLLAIMQAVVAGRFEETFWSTNGRIVKTYGKLDVSYHGTQVVEDMPRWHGFRWPWGKTTPPHGALRFMGRVDRPDRPRTGAATISGITVTGKTEPSFTNSICTGGIALWTE